MQLHNTNFACTTRQLVVLVSAPSVSDGKVTPRLLTPPNARFSSCRARRIALAHLSVQEVVSENSLIRHFCVSLQGMIQRTSHHRELMRKRPMWKRKARRKHKWIHSKNLQVRNPCYVSKFFFLAHLCEDIFVSQNVLRVNGLIHLVRSFRAMYLEKTAAF